MSNFSEDSTEPYKDDNLDYDLESTWTFYVDRNLGLSTGDDYKSNLKKLGQFSTVKTFWSYFNNLPDVSEFEEGFSYHLMKNDLEPVREEKKIADGGQLKITFDKQFSNEVWLEILMSVIGEKLSELLTEDDDFIGLRFGCRTDFDIIQLWNLKADSIDSNLVMQRLKEMIPNKINPNFEYKSFKKLNNHHNLEFAKRRQMNTKNMPSSKKKSKN